MLIRDLLHGVYSHPVRIVAFNTAEGWSQNITTEIATELKQRREEGQSIPHLCTTFARNGGRLSRIRISRFRRPAAGAQLFD
jgi:hypothetical protein